MPLGLVQGRRNPHLKRARQPGVRESVMGMAERIEQKLQQALAPLRLEVRDDSHKHEGHAGWREGGDTHFHVTVIAEAFTGQSRVARQRWVYEILSQELADGVHALQLVTRAPAEDGADS